LADLGDGERAGKSAGCGAVGAAQAEADLPDELVLGRVGRPVLAVHVADGGAGHVEAGHRGAGGGAFDQVGDERSGLGRQRTDPAAGAPPFPDPPSVGVHGADGFVMGGVECGGDPDRVVHGQTERQTGGVIGDGGGHVGTRQGGRESQSRCHGRVVPAGVALPRPGHEDGQKRGAGAYVGKH
jgi:hypothetical protein